MAIQKVTSDLLANNSVGLDQLNLSDGSNGQFLKTNGSGTISFATAGGGGAYEVISSQTISSNVTYVDFTNVFTSTYDTYELHLVGVTGTASTGFWLLNGSTAISSSNNYGRLLSRQSGSASWELYYGNTSSMAQMGSSTQVTFSKMTLRSPLSTAGNSYEFWGHAQNTSNSASNTPSIFRLQETGRNKSGTAANGIRLWGNTNGITGGKVTLYGIKTS